MLKVKIDRETMRKAIEWHAKEGKGLTPVIDDDEDLVDWTHYIISEQAGFHPNEDPAPLHVAVVAPGGDLIISGSKEIFDAVEHYIL